MHLYSLELETQRVWDYVGDGYVHRLIQNKADGKLVELPSASTMTATQLDDHRTGPGPSDTLAAEKIEAIGIEYSYLLAQQLDAQRAHYEQEKRKLEEQVETEVAFQNSLKEQIDLVEKDRNHANQRLNKLGELTRRFEKELREERALTAGLKRNVDSMKEKLEQGEAERKAMEDKLKDVEDQLRDLMFAFEVRDRISKAETQAAEGEAGPQATLAEAAGGDIVVPPPPNAASRRRRKKKEEMPS